MSTPKNFDAKFSQLLLPFNRLRIRVVGVGQAGCISLGRMNRLVSNEVRLLGLDTGRGLDRVSDAGEQVSIGDGFGSGGNPETACEAFGGAERRVRDFVEDADVVVVVAGLGRGTGSGVSPLVAEIARKGGALTLGVVCLPFDFEGKLRADTAEIALTALQDSCDSVISISFDELSTPEKNDRSLVDSFAEIDRTISGVVEAVVGALEISGDSFDDVADSLKGCAESTAFTGIGRGLHAGKNAVEDAFEKLCSKDSFSDLEHFDSAILHVVGGIGMSPGQVAEAVTEVRKNVDSRVELIVSSTRDITMGSSIQVTVVLYESGFAGTSVEILADVPAVAIGAIGATGSIRDSDLTSIFETPVPVRRRGPMLLPTG